MTGDLHKLRLFLLTEINDLCEAIDKREEKNGTETITPAEFSYLQKLFLVRLFTFNVQIGGEASKIKLEQWMNSEKWKRHEDISSIEDIMERLLAQRLKLTYPKRKGKKRVSTLFTDEVNKGLNILVKIPVFLASAMITFICFPVLQEAPITM